MSQLIAIINWELLDQIQNLSDNSTQADTAMIHNISQVS